MTPPALIHPVINQFPQGELSFHASFRSSVLDNERSIIVYLPPGYDADSARKYPVLYLQDGQNLFDGRTCYVWGQHWHLNETADLLIGEGTVEPLIIVGVYHAGQHRIDEYTPSRDTNFNVGGKADLYGRMLVEELKPFIDREYRTLPGREHTGLGGSSLGGLVSLYLGFKRHDIFSRVVAMSPSLWWDRCRFLRQVEEMDRKPPVSLWMDAGTCEGGNTHCNAVALRDKLIGRGFTLGQDLGFMEAEGGCHSEHDWAQRAHHVLRYLYPATKS